MFTQFDKSKREFLAFQESIAKHTVGILTDEGQGVGTGALIRYNDIHLILTAHHVVAANTPSGLRFAFRPQGSLQEAPLRQFGPNPVPLLSGQPIDVSRVAEDTRNDLAGLVLGSIEEITEPAEFYDASALNELLPIDGASLIFQGFPVDNAVELGQRTKAVGAVAEHAVYDSSLNDLSGLPSSYDPSCQFMFKYGWEGELLPHGFSGSPIWCALKQPSAVWTAGHVLIGVITHYIKGHRVLIAANIKPVLSLLRDCGISTR